MFSTTQRVAVSGASGLVGSALLPLLHDHHYTAQRLVRKSSRIKDNDIYWNSQDGSIETSKLEGVHAVVHLAGENIAGRWTPELKQSIRDSRVSGTRFLVQALSQLHTPPNVLVCASAVGFYGERGDQKLSEADSAGEGFLAQVAQEWEAEARAAENLGIRVVRIRIGVVLTPQGGALAKMLLPFRLCLGGTIGSGTQYWSWITLPDLVRAIYFCIANESLSGPVNLVAPQPVTNSEFTSTLAKTLGRPAIFPLPAFAAKLALGEMADALLLTSTRAVPGKLQQAGFQFEHPFLDQALRALL